MIKDDLKELLDHVDMESYLAREGIRYRVTAGTRGTQLNVMECPACGGKSWKVYLNAETGLGNCFHGSCSKGTFNKFSFIKAHLDGVKVSDVINHIRAVASEHGWKRRRTSIYEVSNETELRLPDSVEIPMNGKNLKYLKQRGISSEMAKYFYLRYSHDGNFEYKIQGRKLSQSYAQRVIIPVYDLIGDLVSFQGRDITGSAEKKYLFPPGFASTGRYLYNGHNALGAKRVVICEGAFDVIAAKIALDSDVQLRDVVPIGTFGKHISSGHDDDQIGQLLLLRERGLKEVVFMWDSEPEAIRAAIAAALLVSRIGIKTRLAILPPGKDPNEATVIEFLKAYYGAEPVTRSSAAKLKMTMGK